MCYKILNFSNGTIAILDFSLLFLVKLSFFIFFDPYLYKFLFFSIFFNFKKERELYGKQ